MADENIKTTLQFQADITDFKGAMSEARNAIKLANSQFNEASSGMDDWGKSTDGIKAKLQQLANVEAAQKRQLDVLEKAYSQVVAEQGEASAEAVKLKTQINNQQAAINKTHKSFEKYSDELDNTGKELREVDEAAEEATDGIGALDKVASGVKTTMAAVATAVAGVVTAFFASAEATREHRTAMGKLETAFDDLGWASGRAKDTYEEFYGVLGDQDKAVEASALLAELATNSTSLSEWGTIAAGAFAKFGDSLPIESLIEAANETKNTGLLTGALADALNWAGVNEEAFQKKLDKCTTTQEREALIRKTLNGLYKEAGNAYKETNADIIAANEAQARLNESMAAIGAIAEPIVTTFKNIAATVLTNAVPSIQALATSFMNLFSGTPGAAAEFGETLSGIVSGLVQKVSDALPMVAEIAFSLIGTLTTSLLQQLPQLLTVGGQIIGQLLTGIANSLPGILQTAMDLITQFTTGLQNNLPIVLQKGSEILMNLVTGIANSLPGLVNQALDAIMQFATTIYDNAPTLIDTGFEMLSKLVEGVLNCLPDLIAKVPEIISKFANTINDNFPTILKKGVELILQIIKGIISAIPTLIANIPKIITAIVDVWEAFNWLNLGKKAITFLKDGVLKMVSAVKTAGTNVFNAIVNAIKNLPQNLLNIGKNAITNLGDTLRNGWSTVKNGASALLNGIIGFFKDLPGKVLEIGKDIVRGLWNGISDMTGWVIGKIQGFGESVLGGIKKFFGIKSPSRLMRDEVGKMLGLGMAEGIEQSRSAVNSAVRDLGNAAMSGLSGSMQATAGGYAGGGKTIIINQTNNSPRALSRLEIYRQTHNALAYAGGM